MLNVKEQLKQILNKSYKNTLKYNLNEAGFIKSSILNRIHQTNEDTLTLTINTDGVQIFNSSHIDTWPMYVTINEIKPSLRFNVENICLLGIWVGNKKLSNRIVLNESLKELRKLENGIEINGKLLRLFTIYGSYDKPARSLMLQRQICTATYGCTFCFEKTKRRNRKIYFKKNVLCFEKLMLCFEN